MDARQSISDAATRGAVIRVYREGLEDGWIDAYVAALGPEFVALEVFDKAARLDGYTCLRWKDISEVVSPAPNAGFLTKALRARGLARRVAFEADISSLSSLVESAGRAFPLVSIFFEGDDDDYCHVGRVASVRDNELRLLYISPDARFDPAPTPCPLAGVTRIDFGGSYEEALHLVSGAN